MKNKKVFLWLTPLIPLACLVRGYLQREPPDTRKKASLYIGPYPKLSVAERGVAANLVWLFKQTPDAKIYEVSFRTGVPLSISRASPPTCHVTAVFDDDKHTVKYTVDEPLSEIVYPLEHTQIDRKKIAAIAASPFSTAPGRPRLQILGMEGRL